MALIGYARVSTENLHGDLQKDRLRKAGCERAREHIASGLNGREAATRLQVSKTVLYAALQGGSEQR